MAQKTRNCDRCVSKLHCVGKYLDTEQWEFLIGSEKYTTNFNKGEAIYKVENKFNSLFMVRSGVVKTQSFTYEGNRIVSGFFFPGDLIGIESIGQSTYCNDAIALCTTTICEFSFDKLESLCRSVPLLNHDLMMLFARKIRYSEQAVGRGEKLPVAEKLLSFFYCLFERNGSPEKDGFVHVSLSMSKSDIACHLRLRPESVSRALSSLESEGIIRKHDKSVDLRIVDSYEYKFNHMPQGL